MNYVTGLPIYDSYAAKPYAPYATPSYPDSDSLYAGWNYPVYTPNLNCGLRALVEYSVSFTSQSALATYTAYQSAFTSQSALNAYVTLQAQFVAQSALNAYEPMSVSFNSQNALAVYTDYNAAFTSQSALSVYRDLVGEFNSQSAIAVYTDTIAAFTSQSALNAYVAQYATFTSQSALNANEKFYTWMINLTTGAVSKADNYSFNSLSGSMGADSTGIHSLTGTTDNGVAINGFVESGKLDFGVTERKRMVDAYVGVEGGSLNLTVTDERTGDNTYKLAATTQLKTAKANLGRGAVGRYWKVKIANVAGSPAKVDDIELNIEKLTRKI
ncbi:MAG: hypothetical protein ACXWDN_07065 [Limisphaerales bacterium]